MAPHNAHVAFRVLRMVVVVVFRVLRIVVVVVGFRMLKIVLVGVFRMLCMVVVVIVVFRVLRNFVLNVIQSHHHRICANCISDSPHALLVQLSEILRFCLSHLDYLHCSIRSDTAVTNHRSLLITNI